MQDKSLLNNDGKRQDKSLLSSQPSSGMSEELRQYIDALAEEVVLQDVPFQKQKRLLKRQAEADGVDYESLESKLMDFFKAMSNYKKDGSKDSVKQAEALAKECGFTTDFFEKLVNGIESTKLAKAAEEEKKRLKEQAEKEKKEAEAKLKKAEEEAEAQKKAAEEEKKRLKEQAEKEKKDAEAKLKKAEEEAKAQKKAAEEEKKRLKEQAEKEKKAADAKLKKQKKEAEEQIAALKEKQRREERERERKATARKRIAIAIVIFSLIMVGIWLLVRSCSTSKGTPEEPQAQTEELQLQTESGIDWKGVAVYEGPTRDSIPDGKGGKLTFYKDYEMGQDADGNMVVIKAGEVKDNTVFEDGELRAYYSSAVFSEQSTSDKRVDLLSTFLGVLWIVGCVLIALLSANRKKK